MRVVRVAGGGEVVRGVGGVVSTLDGVEMEGRGGGASEPSSRERLG